MNTRIKLLVIICGLAGFIFFNLSFLFSQDKPLPQWLRMEQGIQSYDEGQLGSALSIFRTIAEDDPQYANVHMWIGHVFAAEGEYKAAVAKYKDALSDERNFFPQAERINAYYSLAEVARRLEDWESMHSYLQSVVDEAEIDPLPTGRVEAMQKNFLNEGPDKLLELYRINDKAVRLAYEQLGLLALQQENYRSALQHLLLSITTSLSLAIEVLQDRDPEYEFIQHEMNPGLERFFTRNTAALLKKSRDVLHIKEYFNSIGLYRQLYFLGMAMLGSDAEEEAKEIWTLVATHSEAGKWANLARNQLGSPSLEVLPTVLQYR
ncbi:MAG: hypothetical protein R6V86_10610 [Spirochaetia bacterium]